MKILILLLLLVPVMFGQTVAEKVAKFERPKDYMVEYDKFAQHTEVAYEVAIKPLRKHAPYDLRMVAAVTLQNDGGAVGYSLFFTPYGYRVLYNNDTVRLLVDGELLSIPSNDIDYSVQYELTASQFQKLASAKKIEIQLASFEGVMNAHTLLALKNLSFLAK